MTPEVPSSRLMLCTILTIGPNLTWFVSSGESGGHRPPKLYAAATGLQLPNSPLHPPDTLPAGPGTCCAPTPTWA